LLDERIGIGETVLHFLAVEKNRPAVEWLHARSADMNATNEFGTPLLFEVAALGYRDLFVWLLQHGADPTKRKSDGQSLDEHLAEHENPDMMAFIKKHVTSTA
jgi:ankyrin repeat protein